MKDILTMFVKEWNELLLSKAGRKPGLVRMLIAVLVLAVVWPLEMGAAYVTSGVGPLFAGYFAAMFVMGTIPDAITGERERHTLETLLSTRLPDSAILLGKVAAAVSYGWGVAIVSLILALVVVNVLHGHGELLLYPATIAIGSVVIGLLAASLVAFIGVLVSLRSQTVKQAQQILTTGLMILVFVPLLGARLIPPGVNTWFETHVMSHGPGAIMASIAVGLLLADIALCFLCLARFQREKLMLE
jgi:ABC-2 type transport system permease protein